MGAAVVKKKQKLNMGRILFVVPLAALAMFMSLILLNACFETTIYEVRVDITVVITLVVAGVLIGSFNRVRGVVVAAILCTTFVTLASFILNDISVVSWRFFFDILMNIAVVAFVGTITRVVLGKRGLKW